MKDLTGRNGGDSMDYAGPASYAVPNVLTRFCRICQKTENNS